MFQEVSRELLDFIGKSYSTFHVIRNMKEELDANGFTELFEEQKWNLKRFEIFLRYSENGWFENLKCMMQI